MMKRNQFVTDLHIKLTDTHQYLNASSCHLFHSKKSVPYSQALKLKNRICSENYFCDKQCNNLEISLRERGYSDKLVWILLNNQHKRTNQQSKKQRK